MAKLARLPANDRPRDRDAADSGHVARLRTRFYAFLSYSHKDKELADWLHRELEKFRVPHALAGKLTANGVVPKRLTPIFRDQHDLAAGDDLAVEIEAALAASQFLVVLCSPTAAKSRWTNLEIESFKRTRPEGCVLAAVADGEPFASDMPGREGEECFPPALRFKYDRRGHQTTKRAEPLAADFREQGEGRRLAFLKLVSGMLGVGLDELVQRETTRRQRRLGILAAASLGGMAVTSTLAVTAIQARDAARDQRREAEGLIGFMLGDLKDKLEPIGRLDALDGVGARVLAYYKKQGTAHLTDSALSQRSQALSLMAQVAFARGELDKSLQLYREAMKGTAEAVRRDPDNPQAVFDHAQNVFYIGEIAHQRGDFRTAEDYMREYQRLAVRMIALGPDSMKWRMEKQYADFNLGVVLVDQRRFAEAVRQFRDSLKTMQAIATADPGNKDYQQQIAESFAWLADADRAIGNYPEAIAARQQGIAVLERLLGAADDVNYQQRLIPARRALGRLYAERGQTDLAAQQLRAAVGEADILIPKEPNNAVWLEYAANARVDLARQLLASGNTSEAEGLTRAACNGATLLVRRDPAKANWRMILSRCWGLQAKLALARGAKADALGLAQRAAEVAKTVHSGDAIADGFLLAADYRLVGEIQQSLGNEDAARTNWVTALRLMPPSASEPDQMAERATILRRLGREADAQQLSGRLARIGYRDPGWLSA
jgi:tetratricopeptide (TPR) repeat protein